MISYPNVIPGHNTIFATILAMRHCAFIKIARERQIFEKLYVYQQVMMNKQAK
jgi:hypothetical protein